MLQVQPLTRERFQRFGRIITEMDFSALLKAAMQTPLTEAVSYEASVECLENCGCMDEVTQRLYGGMPVEIGYCNGHNTMLNAVEYHKSSEIDIAVTDMILLLGQQQDITEDFQYDTAKLEAFLVLAGTGVELYGTTLHFAPCQTSKAGFRSIVILPRGTNTELNARNAAKGEDKLLFAKNKWLIAHPEGHIDGAFLGLIGENLQIGGSYDEI